MFFGVLRESFLIKLMKLKLSTVGALISGALSFSAHAQNTASYSQTFQFPFTFSGVTNSESAQFINFPNSGNYEAMVLPFDIGLGTLDSVDVHWYWGVSFSGVTSASGGGVGMSMAGLLSLANAQYNGSGTSNGAGHLPNTPFSLATNPVTLQNSFTRAGAGLSYDPVIWAALDGNSSYSAKLALGTSSLSYQGLASGTFTSFADLTVTYNYTAVPEPSACALLSLGALSLAVRRRRTA